VHDALLIEPPLDEIDERVAERRPAKATARAGGHWWLPARYPLGTRLLACTIGV